MALARGVSCGNRTMKSFVAYHGFRLLVVLLDTFRRLGDASSAAIPGVDFRFFSCVFLTDAAAVLSKSACVSSILTAGMATPDPSCSDCASMPSVPFSAARSPPAAALKLYSKLTVTLLR